MSTAKYTKKIDSAEAFHIDPISGVDKVSLSRKLSRREKVLFAALLIVLVAAIVFIVLYVLQVSKSKNETEPSKNKQEAGSPSTPYTATVPTAPTAAPACLPADCVFIASG